MIQAGKHYRIMGLAMSTVHFWGIGKEGLRGFTVQGCSPNPAQGTNSDDVITEKGPWGKLQWLFEPSIVLLTAIGAQGLHTLHLPTPKPPAIAPWQHAEFLPLGAFPAPTLFPSEPALPPWNIGPDAANA